MTGRFAAVAALGITLAVSAGFLAIANGFPFGEASSSNQGFFDQITPAAPGDLALPDSGTPADPGAATEASCPAGQAADESGVCATIAGGHEGEQGEHHGEHDEHEDGNGEHESED